VRGLVAESVNPGNLAEFLWEAAAELMKRARDEFAKGEFRQAGERLEAPWPSC